MQIEQILQQFSQIKALVIGDAMIDRYWWGKVNRISPEAPVPVLHLQQQQDALGGAANVATNLQALGATPFLCTIIGIDEGGQRLKQMMLEKGLSTDGLVEIKSRQTTIKGRMMAANQQLLRVDQEDTHDLEEEEIALLKGRIERLLEREAIQLIIFQDYNKGVLVPTLIEWVMAEAKRRGIVTAVDPKRKHFFAYKGATLFKPNLREVQEALQQKVVVEKKGLEGAAAELRERLGQQFTLITLSDKGVYLERVGEDCLASTQPRQIADVCGAGDSVLSIAALAIVSKLSIKITAHLSNLAGGQVCERVGVVPIAQHQLIQDFKEWKLVE